MAIFLTALLGATLGIVSVREAYQSVEWPIIVLLGAMLSMGAALQNTREDRLIAE